MIPSITTNDVERLDALRLNQRSGLISLAAALLSAYELGARRAPVVEVIERANVDPLIGHDPKIEPLRAWTNEPPLRAHGSYDLRSIKARVERETIASARRAHPKLNHDDLALVLGVSRNGLYRKLRKYRLELDKENANDDHREATTAAATDEATVKPEAEREADDPGRDE